MLSISFVVASPLQHDPPAQRRTLQHVRRPAAAGASTSHAWRCWALRLGSQTL